MNNYLPTDYQTFITKSRYAKYIDGEGREDWGDTVERLSLIHISEPTRPY